MQFDIFCYCKIKIFSLFDSSVSFFFIFLPCDADGSTTYIRNRQRVIPIFRSIWQMIWHKRHHKVIYRILDPSNSARVFENGCCVPILLTLADHYMQIVRVLHSSARFDYANANIERYDCMECAGMRVFDSITYAIANLIFNTLTRNLIFLKFVFLYDWQRKNCHFLIVSYIMWFFIKLDYKVNKKFFYMYKYVII